MRALQGHNIMGRRTPAWPSPLAYLVGNTWQPKGGKPCRYMPSLR